MTFKWTILIVMELKKLWGIVNILKMIIAALTKELVLYVLTHLVSANLGLSQMFNFMKTSCIRELLV